MSALGKGEKEAWNNLKIKIANQKTIQKVIEEIKIKFGYDDYKIIELLEAVIKNQKGV